MNYENDGTTDNIFTPTDGEVVDFSDMQLEDFKEDKFKYRKLESIDTDIANVDIPVMAFPAVLVDREKARKCLTLLAANGYDVMAFDTSFNGKETLFINALMSALLGRSVTTMTDSQLDKFILQNKLAFTRNIDASGKFVRRAMDKYIIPDTGAERGGVFLSELKNIIRWELEEINAGEVKYTSREVCAVVMHLFGFDFRLSTGNKRRFPNLVFTSEGRQKYKAKLEDEEWGL